MTITTGRSRPAPVPALLASDLLALVERSHRELSAAAGTSSPTTRYLRSQEAALHAASALLTRVSPRQPGGPPRSAWQTLAKAVPELTEPCTFFASTARRSRAAQAGITWIGSREADDLLREVEGFLARVLVLAGLPPMPPRGGLVPTEMGR